MKENKKTRFERGDDMTVRELLEDIDNLNLIVKVNTVEDDDWKVVSRTTASMRGVPYEVMYSRVISWGVYDNEITIRI